MHQDINEVIFQTQDRVLFRGRQVIFKERNIVLPVRKLKGCPFTHPRQTIEVKDIRPAMQPFAQGKNLTKVVFGQVSITIE